MIPTKKWNFTTFSEIKMWKNKILEQNRGGKRKQRDWRGENTEDILSRSGRHDQEFEMALELDQIQNKLIIKNYVNIPDTPNTRICNRILEEEKMPEQWKILNRKLIYYIHENYKKTIYNFKK